jgi:hypothetical protein
MSSVENLDVITRQGDDAPSKQPLAHTPILLQPLRHGGLSLRSSGVWPSPRSRPRLSTGSQQVRIYCTVRRLIKCQGISPSKYKTQLHHERSSRCINRAVVPPLTTTTHIDKFLLSHSVLDTGTCLNHL